MKAKIFFFVGILLSAFGLTQTALAETKYLAWDPVTTYTDGSPIEARQTVGYKAYWPQDSWLAAETLRPLVSSTTATSAAFDPAAEGIVGYQTVYFTVKTVVGTGTESNLSAAGLPTASLTPLASPTTQTTLTFDPAASGMTGGQRVYFAAKAVLDTGEESALSAALSWSVSNKGPGAPGNGRIVRKNKK